MSWSNDKELLSEVDVIGWYSLKKNVTPKQCYLSSIPLF